EVPGARLGAAANVDLGPTRLPVLVRVADYSQDAVEARGLPDLIDYVGLHPLFEQQLPGEASDRQQLVRTALKDGRALVLIDGLDEVSDQKLREEVVRRIEEFAHDEIVDPVNPQA